MTSAREGGCHLQIQSSGKLFRKSKKALDNCKLSCIFASNLKKMEYVSPLRYPGGKGKLAPFFQQVIQKNDLQGGVYVEPYVGGGAVALTLLFSGNVSRIVINDKDRSIFAFWHSVLYQTEELCQLIADTPINMDTWHEQKEYQRTGVKEDTDLLTLGFSSFFLNRTNRSGIIKGGVIGGQNQDGNYKINARYKQKEELIRRIKKIAARRENIELHHEDAAFLTSHLRKELPANTIFYFDPPYYIKGEGLYMNYYKDKDHADMANAIKQITNQKWIVTYDPQDYIKTLYQDFRQREFNLNYSANNTGKAKEVMIYSDNLIIP